ncbi:hypothetical protein [Winogradskyella ursingii]|uniref:hypothetical protein n=1 Tax=Winogradskyella ursingii TaxID=2686079 RepID=UPI0015CE69B6|nr:hypothetical protein [Winogradskyella ursingii]
MNNILKLLFCFALLNSCQNDIKKIDHTNSETKELIKDSTKREVADLPIAIDSIDYLIHPIGYITEYGTRFSSYSRSNDNVSYNVSSHNSHSLRGEFTNIKFQHVNSLKLAPLFKRVVEINSVSFIDNVRKNRNFEYMIYKVRDADTNGDSKIDHNDVNALYISKIDGSNLKKLTKDLAQIVNWKIITKLNRLYVKSISDTNKNGKFDKEDNINYGYVDLKNPQLKVITYDPTN